MSPLQWRGTGSATGRRQSSPLRRGGALCATGWFIPLRRVVRIHMSRWRLYTIHPLGRTLCTNRLGWSQGNWWLCRRTYSPMDMKCWIYPCVPRPPQYSPTGMMLTGRLLPARGDQRLLHLLYPGPSQIPDNIMHIKSVFFSLRAPISQKASRTFHAERAVYHEHSTRSMMRTYGDNRPLSGLS